MKKTAAVVGGAALALLAARAARAELAAQAVANVTGGATNNPLLAPEGTVSPGLDEFTTVRATAQGLYRGRLVNQLLAYTYTGTFYATATEANSQGHQLLWSLDGTPTARTEVRAQASATYGHLNSINPLAATAALNPMTVATAGFVSLPSNPVTYFGGAAQATGSYRPTGTTLWSEVTSVNSFVPIDGETGHSIALLQTGHYERERARNALLVDLMLSYLDASSLTPPDGMPLQPSPMFQAQGTVGWRRDVSPVLNYALEGGVLLLDATSGNQLSVQPVGKATIHYQTERVLAEVTASESSLMNVYIGQTFMVAGLTARAAVPIDRLQRFRLIGLATGDRQWAIISGGLDAAMDLLAADVGIVYQPLQQPFLASLDYSVLDQIGHTVGGTMYQTVHRQAVLLTLTGTWGTDRDRR